MQSLKDLKGKTFGYIKVINGPFVRNQKTEYECECVCGKKITLNAWYLKHKSRSCGCKNGKHGHSPDGKKSKTYSCWDGIIQRCTNKKTSFYYCYGARGITVCERWLDFKNFLEDMGEKPDGKSIDRIDVNKGYYKENCRWADIYTQKNNTTRNKFYEFDGKIMTLSQASRFYGITRARLNHYMFVRKLRFDEAKKFIFSKENLRKRKNQHR